MAQFAITKVHFDAGVLTRVKLHEMLPLDDRKFDLDEGDDRSVGDVFDLLTQNKRVMVVVGEKSTGYQKGPEVRVASESDELVFVHIVNRVRVDVHDLPHY